MGKYFSIVKFETIDFIFKSVPGPGQYSIRREMDADKSKSEINGLETARVPFGSQTKVILCIRSSFCCYSIYSIKEI